MNNVRSIGATKTVAREASEWLVRLQAGSLTVDEIAGFDEWIRRHPSHKAAFDDLTDTWARLRAMGEHARREGIAEPDPDIVIRYLARRRKRRLGWAAVAATALIAVLAGVSLQYTDRGAVYRTDVGQQTTITLPDGSGMDLNTDTEVEVAFDSGTRHVMLRRGEAYFDVESDAARPFIVSAGRGTIRAIGTRFTVRLKPNAVVAVTVTEGIVEVADGTDNGTNKATDRRLDRIELAALSGPRVSEGQRIEFARQPGQPAPLPRDELERNLAWRQGLLIFDGQTLDEVIAEVGRYTETRLIIADDELRKLRIGGAFRAGDTDALLEVLENGFGIAVSRDGQRSIRLTAQHPATG